MSDRAGSMKVELASPPFGGDRMVVDTARVSFDKLASNYPHKQNASLIRYLAKHDHLSPFTHPKIQLRLTTPIAVSRQLFKHMIGGERAEGEVTDWNEVSRRYVNDKPVMFQPDTLRAKPDGSIKQGSGEPIGQRIITAFEGGPEMPLNQWFDCWCEDSTAGYDILIEEDVAPEQARMILPQAMMTSWIWTGSLAFWARVVVQREDSHAQKETQEVANMIERIIYSLPEFEVSWPALLHYGRIRHNAVETYEQLQTLRDIVGATLESSNPDAIEVLKEWWHGDISNKDCILELGVS